MFVKKKIAACLVVIINHKRMEARRKKRSVWTKQWIMRRDQFNNTEENLLYELRTEDENCYRNFVRMNAEDFDYLLEKVEPLIQKRDTNMRRAVSPTTKLAITLRYLATGNI